MITVVYAKNDTTVICKHPDFESCDYTIVGDDNAVTEAELLQMADMVTPAGWAIVHTTY